jgi:hypothetical protein
MFQAMATGSPKSRRCQFFKPEVPGNPNDVTDVVFVTQVHHQISAKIAVRPEYDFDIRPDLPDCRFLGNPGGKGLSQFILLINFSHRKK